MKQLLSCDGNRILVGLKDRAFLVMDSTSSASSIVELSQFPEESKVKEQQPRNDQAELNDITAVALASFALPNSKTETIFCAVARYNKSFAVYAISNDEFESLSSSKPPTKKAPSIVYQAPKRISCITYTMLPSGPELYEFIPVVITGDLAGDSYAYNVLEKGHRLLLGHTASMLTGITMLKHNQQNCIATADRDEKIRISRFPESCLIEGYLLGHTKYVTAIDAASGIAENSSLLVSCGGDKTVRLWDGATLQEICHVSTEDTSDEIPSDIALNASGKTVAVIFDQSKLLQLYTVKRDNDVVTLVASHIVECPCHPLVISYDAPNNRLLVLMQEPDCFMFVKICDENDADATFETVESGVSITALRDLVTKESILLPDTILEKDKQGNPVLQKEIETRGASGEEVPWKRPERIAIAKEKQRKRRQNRREKNPQTKPKGGEEEQASTSGSM
ncbi:WD repeat-containing protein [Nitzschia inconspicua]|uniref:WD repeat-containing protein n=1 Tax=Nitzschia inconspicua TaxID=303405 RepID=A0A9K3LHZ0_9STRA|nr:WD repeat-containing protein [Nitzschia inconspicua]